ncbi:MAG: hypothetical protein QXJ27_04945 [Thermoplasmata archaeon]
MRKIRRADGFMACFMLWSTLFLLLSSVPLFPSAAFFADSELSGASKEMEISATSGDFEGTLVCGPLSVPSVGEIVFKAYILTSIGEKGIIYCVSPENKSVFWNQTLEGVPLPSVVFAYLVWYGKAERTNITIILAVNTAQGGKLYIFLDDFRYKTDINCIVYPEGNQYLDRIAGISFPEKVISTTQSTTYNALWYPFFVVSEKGKIYELTMMIKPKGSGQTVRDLEIILEPGFTPGNEYVIPGNITVTGEPLQLDGQKFLIITHDQGITFLRYNYTMLYPGPFPRNWSIGAFGNYSFKPSEKFSPATSWFYRHYNTYHPDTPVFAGGNDGFLYLFHLNTEGIANPQKYQIGNPGEKTVGIVTGPDDCTVYSASENGNFSAFMYNHTTKRLEKHYNLALGSKVVYPPCYMPWSAKVIVVSERPGTRILWVLSGVERETGTLISSYETTMNISPPFPTGGRAPYNLTLYDPDTGNITDSGDTGELLVLCDTGANRLIQLILTPLMKIQATLSQTQCFSNQTIDLNLTVTYPAYGQKPALKVVNATLRIGVCRGDGTPVSCVAPIMGTTDREGKFSCKFSAPAVTNETEFRVIVEVYENNYWLNSTSVVIKVQPQTGQQENQQKTPAFTDFEAIAVLALLSFCLVVKRKLRR